MGNKVHCIFPQGGSRQADPRNQSIQENVPNRQTAHTAFELWRIGEQGGDVSHYGFLSMKKAESINALMISTALFILGYLTNMEDLPYRQSQDLTALTYLTWWSPPCPLTSCKNPRRKNEQETFSRVQCCSCLLSRLFICASYSFFFYRILSLQSILFNRFYPKWHTQSAYQGHRAKVINLSN